MVAFAVLISKRLRSIRLSGFNTAPDAKLLTAFFAERVGALFSHAAVRQNVPDLPCGQRQRFGVLALFVLFIELPIDS